nr:hypothetical protein [Tanacetum cinerariifolium]
MIDQGVTAALAARDALRSTNGNDSHNSGIGVRRTKRAARECTYTDFLKCQPLPFKGTEGVASLSQWCEEWSLSFTSAIALLKTKSSLLHALFTLSFAPDNLSYSALDSRIHSSVSSASVLPLVRLLFPHPSMNHVHMFMKLHYWTLTLVVSQTSTFITGASSLILSSSRCLAILDYVASLLVISTLYSARPTLVRFALVA